MKLHEMRMKKDEREKAENNFNISIKFMLKAINTNFLKKIREKMPLQFSTEFPLPN
jgi:hypothetical protein